MPTSPSSQCVHLFILTIPALFLPPPVRTQLYNTMVPQRRAISRNQQDGFFERLLDDANKRRARVEKMLGEKMAKEKESLGSTKLYARRTTH